MHDETVATPDPLDAIVRGARGRALGVLSASVLIFIVLLADVVEGPATAYVGVLTAAPLLAAVFARPTDVLVVGLLAMAFGQGYAVVAGSGTTQAQLVRLGFLAAGTAVAVAAAFLRQVRDRQLRLLTDVAEAAQATILRPVPGPVGRLAFAARYRSAAAAANVGGDFYDVLATPHGVRVLVGDVRGKGLDAVLLAAGVLGSFREVAFTAGPDLAAVARAVGDSTARLVGAEDFVTAVFIELGSDGHGRLVRCGHPPPLIIGSRGVQPVGGTVEQPPLGLVVRPVAEPLLLAAGERLLLFTDGLSEARDRSGCFFDVDAAAATLLGGDLDRALDRLLACVDEHTGHRLNDDLALLVIEHLPEPAGPEPVQAPPVVRQERSAAEPTLYGQP